MTPQDLLADGAARVGVALPADAAAAILRHCELVMSHSPRLGLSGRSSIEDLIREDVVDSLAVAPLLPEGASLLDIGSGAGFPGITLALARPDLSVVLCEPSRKRAAFLRLCLVDLDLPGVSLVQRRAEDLGRDGVHRAAHALLLARAVAALPTLAELGLPLLEVGGRLLAMKGPAAEREAQTAAGFIERLGGRVVGVQHLPSPLSGKDRRVVVVEKVAVTPDAYPRRPPALGRMPRGG